MQSICTFEACPNPQSARGYCNGHYKRLISTGTPFRPCARCGDELPLGTNGRTTLCTECRKKCAVDGCDNPVRRNGMCASHSHRVTVSGTHKRACRACGAEIPLEAGAGLRYCSEECKPRCTFSDCSKPRIARGLCKEHYRRWKHNGSASRQCLTCGSEFPIGETRGRTYCSDECAPRCTAPGCEERAEGELYCSRHGFVARRWGSLPSYNFECVECGTYVERSYSEKAIKPTRRLCAECSARRKRDHRKFRDSVIASGFAECGICGEGIDLALEWPDPMSLTIDHIVPLICGGTNEERNLQPAHQICNFRKGPRLAIPEEGVDALF